MSRFSDQSRRRGSPPLEHGEPAQAAIPSSLCFGDLFTRALHLTGAFVTLVAVSVLFLYILSDQHEQQFFSLPVAWLFASYSVVGREIYIHDRTFSWPDLRRLCLMASPCLLLLFFVRAVTGMEQLGHSLNHSLLLASLLAAVIAVAVHVTLFVAVVPPLQNWLARRKARGVGAVPLPSLPRLS